VEIRSALGLSEDQYHELLATTSAMAVASLEELVEEDQHGQVEEGSPPAGPDSWGEDPAEIMDQAALQELLALAVEQLPERDRIVIGLYYQDELTLREIGEVLSVTESRVCQIHTQAIARLRVSVQGMLAA